MSKYSYALLFLITTHSCFTAATVKKSAPVSDIDVVEISHTKAAMAVLEHIFTLQKKQSAFQQNTPHQVLKESTSRSSATYAIRDGDSFSISATIAPTFKGVTLSRIWASSALADKPFQTLHTAFHDASFWTNASAIPLGKFFTCRRESAYKEITCTSGPALTKELFQRLKAMHEIRQPTVSEKK